MVPTSLLSRSLDGEAKDLFIRQDRLHGGLRISHSFFPFLIHQNFLKKFVSLSSILLRLFLFRAGLDCLKFIDQILGMQRSSLEPVTIDLVFIVLFIISSHGVVK